MQNSDYLVKDDLELIEIAKEHAKKSYKEGIISMAAVLRTKEDRIYTGINVKHRKIWKCICAERVTIAKALEAGEARFDTMVTVKYFPEKNEYEVINMCGECRQIAICHSPLKVIVDNKGTLTKVSIEKVFPYPYT